jgi:hypothetical protein
MESAAVAFQSKGIVVKGVSMSEYKAIENGVHFVVGKPVSLGIYWLWLFGRWVIRRVRWSLALLGQRLEKATAKEVVSVLAAKGIKVKEGLVYGVKGYMKGRKGRRRKAQRMVSRVAATGNTDPVKTILKIKDWAGDTGGANPKELLKRFKTSSAEENLDKLGACVEQLTRAVEGGKPTGKAWDALLKQLQVPCTYHANQLRAWAVQDPRIRPAILRLCKKLGQDV